MNQINQIVPYRTTVGALWCFDDPDLGLHREPFVDSASELIDDYLAGDANSLMCSILFSHAPFPQYSTMLERGKAEYDGWWYHDETTGKTAWLCDALSRYYDEPPEKLYVQIRRHP